MSAHPVLLRRWAAPSAWICLIAGLGLAAHRAPTLALVNASPSLPRGLYVRDFAGRASPGAIVVVPQPDVARAYLGDLGMPANVLLIKRVAARGGDRVCRDGGRVVTPERTVVANRVDRNGVALPQWRGCRVLKEGELFLLGDTAESFDSRYFGPVDRRRLTGVYREAVLW
ncbi:S26 family signal peptidase [Brevundimonas sp. SL130]|uniref:S26 family signal peptidase n=1 Tax=Brevundimonas sp. SL130 TaxID=2995143 RepID=UPI00226C6A0A|nr:S26 family signal peptidase [Brevundimonas sp. SL130]WAC61388.1 S26 family signal peptidase [Brevundimonas sp. SL130]